MNKKSYFHRVTEQSENRFWINNPTPEEAELAIKAGAISCTTNPSYSAKMLQTNSEYERVISVIDEVIEVKKDDSEAAAEIQRTLIKPILEKFLPLYEKNPRVEGFVSIQGDPHAEENPDSIIEEAMEDMKLSENVIPKIPVTEAGLKAIEVLLAEDIPVIATEIMGISQAISVCELHRKIAEEKGKKPPLYVTHITGIFDEYLKKLVEREGIEISKDVLWQAGCAVARKQYRILKEQGYDVIMLGGGARDLHHFTEMIGSSMHITINWKGTADKLIEQDPPVVYRMDSPTPKYVIEELLDKIPDFRRAYLEDGLEVEEYMDFGPVKYFRDSFIEGWDFITNAIKERRKIISRKE